MTKIAKKPDASPKNGPKNDHKDHKDHKTHNNHKNHKPDHKDKPGDKDGPDKKRADWRKDFNKVDNDHNGKLTKSELKVPKAARKVYDRNDNGLVGRKEFRVASRKIGHFGDLDKNDDGRMSRVEFRHRDDRKGHAPHDGNQDHGPGHKNNPGKDDHQGPRKNHNGPDNDHKPDNKPGHKPGNRPGHKPGNAGSKAGRPHHGGHNDGPPGKIRARHRNLDDLPRSGPDLPPLPGKVEGDTDLVISSFNVLGSSHTVAGGEKPGMASGVARIRTAAQLLDDHNVGVVGFQEFQPDQVKEFLRVAGDKYAVYPGMKLGRGPNVNSIGWRKDTFELVKADTIPIPYFDGKMVKMPVVRLRNKETGQEFYIANFHNPASTKKQGNHEHFRDEATRREVDLVNRLRKQTGLPVFITGDMNESDEYYQKMTRGAPGMHASATTNKRVRRGIDWIFGSKDVTFSRHLRDTSAKVQRTTDHPMIVSRARIHKNGG